MEAFYAERPAPRELFPLAALDPRSRSKYDMYESYRMYLSESYRMTKLAVSKAREDLAEMLNRVAYARERLVIERRGKNLAALIPIEDLELLELLEDKIDLEAARKAIAQAKTKGEKPLSWKDVKKKLGL